MTETKSAPDAGVSSTLDSPDRATEGPADLPDLSIASGLGSTARYEVLELLGRGGMGEVRHCRDRLIGRDIARKTLREGRSGSDGIGERFLREARVQGQLEHPAVVPVYDVGLGTEGEICFTMKRVLGRTLERAIAEAATSPDRSRAQRRLLGAFVSVCQALEYAHSRGVIHRDLKPQNIMLGDFGEVYVLDWGIAKVAAAVESGEARVTGGEGASGTQAGQLLGTPGYMSPEQLEGAIDVDARTDVYALGAILFEILAARPLHEGSVVEIAADAWAGRGRRRRGGGEVSGG